GGEGVGKFGDRTTGGTWQAVTPVGGLHQPHALAAGVAGSGWGWSPGRSSPGARCILRLLRPCGRGQLLSGPRRQAARIGPRSLMKTCPVPQADDHRQLPDEVTAGAAGGPRAPRAADGFTQVLSKALQSGNFLTISPLPPPS